MVEVAGQFQPMTPPGGGFLTGFGRGRLRGDGAAPAMASVSSCYWRALHLILKEEFSMVAERLRLRGPEGEAQAAVLASASARRNRS